MKGRSQPTSRGHVRPQAVSEPVQAGDHEVEFIEWGIFSKRNQQRDQPRGAHADGARRICDQHRFADQRPLLEVQAPCHELPLRRKE